MKLDLFRITPTNRSTIGKLSIDGVFFCFVLENPLHFVPELGPEHIAIRPGTFEVTIVFSNRFQRRVPLLLNVPGRTHIEIHAGNSSKDTHGCILVGDTAGIDSIGQSVAALGKLMGILEQTLKTETISIEVHDPTGADPQTIQAATA